MTRVSPIPGRRMHNQRLLLANAEDHADVLKGTGVLIAWLLLPLAVFIPPALTDHQFALEALYAWLGIVCPHEWLVRRVSNQSLAVLPGVAAPLAAVAQWLVVAIAFGLLTKSRSQRFRLVLAPLVILTVSLVFYLAATMLGFTFEAEIL